MPISIKQQRFVDEYMTDCNGAQAAIRAGYSKKTAKEQASRLLTKVNVQQSIAARQSALSEKTGVTQEMIIAGLLAEANHHGDDASHGARVSAWTQLGRHLGLFERDNEQSGKSVLSHLSRAELQTIVEATQNVLDINAESKTKTNSRTQH